MDAKVKKLLAANQIKTKLITHRKVYTAFNEAETTKKKLSEIAKVVLVKVESSPNPVIARSEATKQSKPSKGKIASLSLAMTKKKVPSKYFVLIVLPAGKYVDFSGIKKALKARKVSIASEKDITKYLKTKVGLLHPFGHLYQIPTLIDKGLAKAKKMVASAGSYTHSVELGLKDFEKLVKPIKGAFSRARKP